MSYSEKLKRRNTTCYKNKYEKNICKKIIHKKNICEENKTEWVNCIRRFEKSRCPIEYRECNQHWTDFIICSNRQKLKN